MEHITITDLKNGFFRLVPDNGYQLMSKSLPTSYYSEAVTKNPNEFVAVPL